MFRDPVCGMQVEDDTPYKAKSKDGRTYGFCSQACKDEFLESDEASGYGA